MSSKKDTEKTVEKKKPGRKSRAENRVVKNIKFSLTFEDYELFDELCMQESRTYAAQVEYLIKNAIRSIKMKKERVEREAQISFKKYVESETNKEGWFEDTQKIALDIADKLGIICESDIIDIQKMLEDYWFEEYVYSKEKQPKDKIG